MTQHECERHARTIGKQNDLSNGRKDDWLVVVVAVRAGSQINLEGILVGPEGLGDAENAFRRTHWHGNPGFEGFTRHGLGVGSIYWGVGWQERSNIFYLGPK